MFHSPYLSPGSNAQWSITFHVFWLHDYAKHWNPESLKLSGRAITEKIGIQKQRSLTKVLCWPVTFYMSNPLIEWGYPCTLSFQPQFCHRSIISRSGFLGSNYSAATRPSVGTATFRRGVGMLGEQVYCQQMRSAYISHCSVSNLPRSWLEDWFTF